MTSKQMAEIRRRNLAGQNDVEIAKALNIPKVSVWHARTSMGLPVAKACKRKTSYTIWSAKTDELLALGTADECTKALGLANENSFYRMVAHVRAGRNKRYIVEKEAVWPCTTTTE